MIINIIMISIIMIVITHYKYHRVYIVFIGIKYAV